jgi:hypothetical protein
MNVTAGIAAATMLAGAAVGFASPARAADFSGTFIPNGPGMQSTWVVTPCGPDCARIADSTGWTAEPTRGPGSGDSWWICRTGRSATTTVCYRER